MSNPWPLPVGFVFLLSLDFVDGVLGDHGVPARFFSVSVVKWFWSAGDEISPAPGEDRLDEQGKKGQQSQQRSDSESAYVIVVVVQNLDVERDSIGESADMAGNYRDGTELAHGASVTQYDSVENSPTSFG